MKTSLLILIAIQLGFAAFSTAAPVVITAPTVITQSGAYILGNQIVVNPTIPPHIPIGINIQADYVSIDFNGYSLISAGGTNGVLASGHSFITLQNGTIAGFPFGVVLSGTGMVGNLIKQMNVVAAGNGIDIHSPSSASRISDCQVSNCNYGILTHGGVSVLQNGVSKCTTVGISAVTGDFAARNTVSNSLYGIFGGKYQGNLTSGCTVPFIGGIDAGENN